MPGRRGLWRPLAVIALVLLTGRALAILYSEYRWFEAVDALDVWELRLNAALGLRLMAFAIASAFAFVNLWGVRHSIVSLVRPQRVGDLEIGEQVSNRTLMSVVVACSVVVGALLAIPASDWQGFVLARTGVPFDETDPYFNADLGFFVYWLPFERSVYAWVLGVVASMTVLVVALYALTPSLRWEAGRVHVSTYVRRHVGILAGAVLAILAWSFRLNAYGALMSSAQATRAFGAFDLVLGIPVATVLSYILLAAAVVVAWSAWTRQIRIALAVITLVLIVTPIVRYALPVLARWAAAPVDPEVRDRPYAAVRAGFTRRAYAVERIRPLPPEDALPREADAALTTVWDPATLVQAIERARRRGPVVGAPAVAFARGGPQLIVTEAPQRVDGPGGSGWSVVRAMAHVTDERGAVVFVDKLGRYPREDEVMPPVLVADGARGYAIVADTGGELAAPALVSFGARLAEAWNEQDIRLLASPVTGGRLVRRRDVRERVGALLPFFAIGTRVFPIVHADSLLWTVDVYATTRNFPLARRVVTPQGEVTYFRRAGTALVNATTGRVTILLDADLDPIAQTWARRLPSTLGRIRGVSSSLLALLPPDVDGAEVQAEAFAAVGARGESTPRRHVPALDGSDTLVTSHAPTLTWLPTMGAQVWTTTLLDDRDRVTGLLVASGGERRELQWFAVTDSTLRWATLLEELSRAASGLGVHEGDRRAAGRVRALPLRDGRVLALQPFYGWPASGPIYVSQVAMVNGATTRAAPSLAAAVGAPTPARPLPTTTTERWERVQLVYAELRSALRRGDWRAFAAAMDALGALLDRR
jgi:uncharacterized membrane protein (UPF0182 family)